MTSLKYQPDTICYRKTVLHVKTHGTFFPYRHKKKTHHFKINIFLAPLRI